MAKFTLEEWEMIARKEYRRQIKTSNHLNRVVGVLIPNSEHIQNKDKKSLKGLLNFKKTKRK